MPPLTRQQLITRLEELGIKTTTIEHPPAFTVADLTEADRQLPGVNTKNLFLRDDKGAQFLIVAKTSTRVDLKYVAKALGAGRLSFGKPELLMSVLGVTPGSVTAFAVVNDAAQLVTVIIDEALISYDNVNCHPLENTATTNIARDDLLRFIRSTGHEPRITALSL